MSKNSNRTKCTVPLKVMRTVTLTMAYLLQVLIKKSFLYNADDPWAKLFLIKIPIFREIRLDLSLTDNVRDNFKIAQQSETLSRQPVYN